ncbi:hypothetical protein ABW21_db0203153 [Orbilia brochopaga]|nr:hypothetical protein ABW21_db0203153 [Drechslerella brochopaga]
MRHNILLQSLLCLAAGIGFCEAKCNSDGCATVVQGIVERNAASLSQKKADCSSFMAATSVISSTTTTVTVTATGGGDAEDDDSTMTKTVTQKAMLKQRPNRFRRRDEADIIHPTAVPEYAQDACSASSQYASACSCWGIAQTTVTVKTLAITVTKTITATPDTDDNSSTVTKTATVTASPKAAEPSYDSEPPKCKREERMCSGACKNVYNDCEHCGACGIQCKKGAVCVNGVCSEPTCKGIKPWECNGKNRPGCNGQLGEDCFCLHSGDVGFCATYMTLPICEESQSCKADSECPLGKICGSLACCGNRVCIEPHGLGAMKTCGNPISPSRLFRKTKARKSAEPNPVSESEPEETDST